MDFNPNLESDPANLELKATAFPNNYNELSGNSPQPSIFKYLSVLFSPNAWKNYKDNFGDRFIKY